MSHFAVMVVGPMEKLEKTMAPFHEFECTGLDDEYVQSLDLTQEARDEYATQKRSTVRLADGTMIESHDAQLYRDPTEEEKKTIGIMAGSGCGNGIHWTSRDWDGTGYKTRVWFLPEGAVEIETPTSDTQSFLDFVKGYYGVEPLNVGWEPDPEKHKYGYVVVGDDGNVVSVIRRTNPNKKWDWYVPGGRWNNHLIIRDDAPMADFIKQALKQHVHVGMDLLGIKDHGFTLKNDQLHHFTARKVDIDVEAMRRANGEAAGKRWDEIRAIAPRPWKKWETVLNEHGVDERRDEIDAARTAYWAQEGLKDVQVKMRFLDSLDNYVGSREDVVAAAERKALVVYAFIDAEGKWHGRGDMGWFGMSDDKVTDDEWASQFEAFFNSIPADEQVTIVDCHI